MVHSSMYAPLLSRNILLISDPLCRLKSSNASSLRGGVAVLKACELISGGAASSSSANGGTGLFELHKIDPNYA